MKKKFFIKNLMMLILPLLIPLIILGTFSISITQRYIRNDIDNNNIKSLNHAKESIELIFNELDSLSINFELNPSVVVKLKELLSAKTADYDNLNSMANIMNMLNSPVNSKPYIHSLYVYYKNENQNYLVSNEGLVNINNFLDTSWYDTFLANVENPVTLIQSRDIKVYEFEKEKTRLITLYKYLHSPGSRRADGVIVMNIKRDYITDLLKGHLLFDDQSLLILGDDSAIAQIGQSPDGLEAKLRSSDIDLYDSNYKVSYIPSARYPITYISIIPAKSLYKIPMQLTSLTALLLLTSLLLSIALSFFITRKNYNNINNIISTLESAERGEPLPELPSRINDEYGYILQNIIKTFIEQSYLKVQLSEKRYRLKAIEIMALQAQINPHFLFNTLKTIFWKAIGLTKGENEVSKMIEYLTGILQYSLASSEKTVTLEEEIKNTLSYIEIQRMRYKDKFGVTWQYDEDIVQHKVMKLLFQPFVENSLYHGIKEKDGSGFIKIKIKQVESFIKVTIIDNGLGIDKENLSNIRARLLDDSEHCEHIGLYNTHKRLKLMYGDSSGIEIRGKRGLGTVVYIRIPVT